MGPGPPWSPETPPKAFSLMYSCPACSGQLGASPEPKPLGFGGLSHLCLYTPMLCLALWLRACPFGGWGGAPSSPS